jgi:hypothetical protein
MKRPVTALTLLLILILTLSHLKAARGESLARLVLPNPKLLRCKSSNCLQLFSEDVGQKDIAPKQIVLDMNDGCVYGITARYDKSVPIDRIKSEISTVYKQWSMNYPSETNLYLWRVEPEKFAINLAVTDKEDKKRIGTEVGTRQLMYIAFGGRSACDVP